MKQTFKIFFAISFFLLNYGNINAQTPENKPIRKLGKVKVPPKPIEQSEVSKGNIISKLACIQDLKVEVTTMNTTGGKGLKLSFSTLDAIIAQVDVEKWGSYSSGENPRWHRVLDNYGGELAYDVNGRHITKDHNFHVGMSYIEKMVPGNRYRLQLYGETYKLATTERGVENVPDRKVSCETEFTTGPKPISRLRKVNVQSNK